MGWDRFLTHPVFLVNGRNTVKNSGLTVTQVHMDIYLDLCGLDRESEENGRCSPVEAGS